MSQPSVIPQKLMTAALLHFTQGVPIDDCDCEPAHRKSLARVDHVYWIWKRNPFLETYPMFQQLVRKQYTTKSNENRVAHADQRLFDFVKDQCSQPDRKTQEERVRAAANHLMRMGMETDNGLAIADGAKIIMRLDRLDQPEEERADMSKVAFMPTVVVTDIRQVDDTKEEIDDEETKRIISKYNAFVDEKHQMIEDKVNMIEARSQANAFGYMREADVNDEGDEQDRNEPEREQ